MFILCLSLYVCGYAQSYEFTEIKESSSQLSDEKYEKDIKSSKDRNFKLTPSVKYKGKDFEYDDHVKAQKPEENKKEEKTINSTPGVRSGLSLRVIVMIVLGILAIMAILYKADFSYFQLSKYRQQEGDELVSIEDNIDENDYPKLLAKAIKDKNYRLATRYYYLSLIHKLSQKEYIEYHKDKTNSEYLFELKEEVMRNGFSYLSYIYSYVWYGEFPVDEVKFATIEKQYQSFMNQIK